MGWEFVDRISPWQRHRLLLIQASNASRRLDRANFEAPNRDQGRRGDRGSMIRIPIGNELSMRVEVSLGGLRIRIRICDALDLQSGSKKKRRNVEDQNLRSSELYFPYNIYKAVGRFPRANGRPELLGNT